MGIRKFVVGLIAAAALVAPVVGIAQPVAAASGVPINDIVYDSVLREYVSANFDLNHDGAIDAFERVSATDLVITNPAKVVHGLDGLDFFTILRKINIKTDIELLDFSKFMNLEELTIDGANKVEDVEIAFNTKLVKATFTNCLFGKVSTTNCAALKTVTIADKEYLAISKANFPDDVLRREVLKADTDGDKLLSKTEIQNFKWFEPSESSEEYIHDLTGLDMFTNLVSIKMYYDGGKKDNPSAEEITLDLSIYPNLYNFRLYDDGGVKGVILTKDPSDPNFAPSKLEIFRWCDSAANVTPLDFSYCPRLRDLVVIRVDVNTVDIRNCTEVNTVDIGGETIEEIKLPAATELGYLDVSYTSIKSLDLSGCPNIGRFFANDSSLETLTLGEKPYMYYMNVSDSNVAKLDLSGCPALQGIDVAGTPMEELNISACPRLINLYTQGERKLYEGVNESTGKPYAYYAYNGGGDGPMFVDVDLIITTTPPVQPVVPSNPSVPSSPSVPGGSSVPSTPSAPAGSTSEGGVAGFVERLYTVALGRASEPNGKAAWIAAIRGGESGAEVAKGFLFSDEFLNKNMSNADFVTVLYKTFFDRQPDAAGHAAWVAALERGESKQDVIMGFINSTEWANVCVKYGIVSGGTGVANIVVEPNESVVAFATRLYTTCLKRTPDNAGLMAWARQLANLRDTGTNAAHGFFFSEEMNNNPVSNEEFVTRLYLTFMDRNPDEGGFNAWVGQLNSGVSREEVFQGFAQSTEFGTICANYGIIR